MKLLMLKTGEQVSDSEVQQLLDEVEKYTLASHLLWGLWGIVSVSELIHTNIGPNFELSWSFLLKIKGLTQK
jgi:choline/ethanolamine kinase